MQKLGALLIAIFGMVGCKASESPTRKESLAAITSRADTSVASECSHGR